MKKNIDLSSVVIKSVSIFFVFIFIIISCYIMLSAFFNIRDSKENITAIITQATQNMRDSSQYAHQQIYSQNKTYLDQLEAKSQKLMDSATISFLFQMFSIALLSLFLYLLNESKKDVKNIKGTIEEFNNKVKGDIEKYNMSINKYNEILNITGSTFEIENYLSTIYLCSWLIQISNRINTLKSTNESHASKSMNESYLVTIREYFNSLEIILLKLEKEKNKIRKILFDLYMDHLTGIRNNFIASNVDQFDEKYKICLNILIKIGHYE
jgi:hypothetical protein